MLALTGCTALQPPGGPEPDSVSALVDLSRQDIRVIRTRPSEEITEAWRWPVSTGRPGDETPTGSFVPDTRIEDRASPRCGPGPLAWPVFFADELAIHGTSETGRLGDPVSRGCVRVHPAHAELFFRMVQEVGPAYAVITVQE